MVYGIILSYHSVTTECGWCLHANLYDMMAEIVRLDLIVLYTRSLIVSDPFHEKDCTLPLPAARRVPLGAQSSPSAWPPDPLPKRDPRTRPCSKQSAKLHTVPVAMRFKNLQRTIRLRTIPGESAHVVSAIITIDAIQDPSLHYFPSISCSDNSFEYTFW